jgi:hypothetical protein
MEIIKNEPVLIQGLIQAVLGLLLAFGISVSDEQIGSIMAVTAVILAIIARMVVTPTNKLPAPADPAANQE